MPLEAIRGNGAYLDPKCRLDLSLTYYDQDLVNVTIDGETANYSTAPKRAAFTHDRFGLGEVLSHSVNEHDYIISPAELGSKEASCCHHHSSWISPPMSETFQTFDQEFQAWAQNHPSHLAFKIPDPSISDSIESPAWIDVSIDEFDRNVDALASVYDRVLNQKGIGRGAIVSLLMSGKTYFHILHTLALSRAGFVPHLLPSTLSTALTSVVPRVGSWIVFYDASDPAVHEIFNAQKKWPVSVCEMPPYSVDNDGDDARFKAPRRHPGDWAFVLHDPSSDNGHRTIEYTFKQIYLAIHKLVSFEKTFPNNDSVTSDEIEIVMSNYSLTRFTGLIDILSLPLLPRRSIQLSSYSSLPTLIHSLQRCHRVYTSQESISPLLNLAKSSSMVRERLQQMKELRYEICCGSTMDAETKEVIKSSSAVGMKMTCIYTAPHMGILMASTSHSTPLVLHPSKGFARKFVHRQRDTQNAYELTIPADASDSANQLSEQSWRTGDLFEVVELGDGGKGFVYLGPGGSD